MAFLAAIRAAGTRGVNIKYVGRTKPFSKLRKRERVEVFDDLLEGLIAIRTIKTSKKSVKGGEYQAYIALK